MLDEDDMMKNDNRWYDQIFVEMINKEVKFTCYLQPSPNNPYNKNEILMHASLGSRKVTLHYKSNKNAMEFAHIHIDFCTNYLKLFNS